MTNKRAVSILRGIKDRIDEVEETVSNQEGLPNLLRFTTDQATTGDVTEVRDNDAKATDQSETGDGVAARDNDAKATSQSTTGDTATASTDDAGGWTWDDSHYDFDEWG